MQTIGFVAGANGRRLSLATGLVCAVLASGCGVDFAYLIPAATGQIGLLQRTLPIEEAINSSSLTDEQVDKLRLIQDVRIYARDVMQLQVGDNYTTFYNSGDQPVAYNVSASRKDRFEPRLWTFPIVGTVPYLGYFDLARANAKRSELLAQGLDVFMYEIDAYSGIGFFTNPVLSPMLDRDELNLIDTVLHELLHNTIWRINDTSFNESLATFFGRTGALRYLADRYPDDASRLEDAAQRFEDLDRYSDFALELYNELDAFYTDPDLTSEEKVAGREAVYQAGRERFRTEIQPLMNNPAAFGWVADLPSNNAWMLGIRRYHLDLEVFERVFEANRGSWPGSVAVFRSAAAAADPYDFLRRWLEDRGVDGLAASGENLRIHSPEMMDAGDSGAAVRGVCAREAARTLHAVDP